MVELASWYQETCRKHSIGFFQIGGGIAGDFPICVVPMLEQNLKIACSALGLFLPDQRLDHELRVVLGCCSKREDLMGQAFGSDTEVHHRVRRHHRGTAHFRLCPGPIADGSVCWLATKQSHPKKTFIAAQRVSRSMGTRSGHTRAVLVRFPEHHKCTRLLCKRSTQINR